MAIPLATPTPLPATTARCPRLVAPRAFDDPLQPAARSILPQRGDWCNARKWSPGHAHGRGENVVTRALERFRRERTPGEQRDTDERGLTRIQYVVLCPCPSVSIRVPTASPSDSWEPWQLGVRLDGLTPRRQKTQSPHQPHRREQAVLGLRTLANGARPMSNVQHRIFRPVRQGEEPEFPPPFSLRGRVREGAPPRPPTPSSDTPPTS